MKPQPYPNILRRSRYKYDIPSGLGASSLEQVKYQDRMLQAANR